MITLTATPASGSSFSGWSGEGRAGTDPCVLADHAPVTVTATFALAGAVPGAAGSVALVVTGNPATEPYAVEAQTTLTVKAEVSCPENTEVRCPLFTDVRVS